MARASWTKGKPLDAFTSGYRPHRTDRRAINEWTVARLSGRTPTQLRRWLDEGEKKTLEAMNVLGSMKSTTKVERAKANAESHLQWLRLIRAELDRLRPNRGAAVVSRSRPKPRPGYLQTEVKAFQATRKKGRSQ